MLIFDYEMQYPLKILFYKELTDNCLRKTCKNLGSWSGLQPLWMYAD